MNSILKKIITSLFVTVITVACADAQIFVPPSAPKSDSQQSPVTLEQLMAALNDPAVLKMAQDAAKDPNSVIISSPELTKLMQDKVHLQITLEMLEAIKKVTKKEEKKGWAQEKLDSLKSLGLLFAGSQAFLIALYCTHPLWGRLVKGVSMQAIGDFTPAFEIVKNNTRPIIQALTKESLEVAGYVIKETAKKGIEVTAGMKDNALKSGWGWYIYGYFILRILPVITPVIQGLTTTGISVLTYKALQNAKVVAPVKAL